MTWLWIVIIAVCTGYGYARFSQKANESSFLPKRKLLLVMLTNPGETPSNAILEWAAECMVDELGLNVHLQSHPVLIPRECLHSQRSQVDAVRLIEELENFVGPDFAILALTEYDLHSPLRRDLPFALGAKKGQAGLISTFRMEDAKKPENTKERLRKMLVRYGAELVCDARRDHDPRSVLYEHLQRPEQLDLMEWPPTEDETP